MTEQVDIEHLIAQAALNNHQAFGLLYDATSTKLYSVCLKVLNNPAHAETAVQDAYIKIWHSANKYQANGLSPMTWLITITRNTAIDKLRTLGDSYQSLDIESIAASKQKQKSRCLTSLETKQANAIRHVYLQGATYSDISKKYSAPIKITKMWLRRSLLELKGAFKQ